MPLGRAGVWEDEWTAEADGGAVDGFDGTGEVIETDDCCGFRRCWKWSKGRLLEGCRTCWFGVYRGWVSEAVDAGAPVMGRGGLRRSTTRE